VWIFILHVDSSSASIYLICFIKNGLLSEMLELLILFAYKLLYTDFYAASLLFWLLLFDIYIFLIFFNIWRYLFYFNLRLAAFSSIDFSCDYYSYILFSFNMSIYLIGAFDFYRIRLIPHDSYYFYYTKLELIFDSCKFEETIFSFNYTFFCSNRLMKTVNCAFLTFSN